MNINSQNLLHYACNSVITLTCTRLFLKIIIKVRETGNWNCFTVSESGPSAPYTVSPLRPHTRR